MPSTETAAALSFRDRCLLQALYLSPLTPQQLLTLSQRTWPDPFHHYKILLRRLNALAASERAWLTKHEFLSGILPSRYQYFRVAPLGYAALTGSHHAMPPGNYGFGPIPEGLERHVYGLSQIVLHLLTSASAAGVKVGDCEPDGARVHRVERHQTIPDFSLRLTSGSEQQLHFAIEFDRSTKSQRSRTTSDTLEFMVKSYEALYYHRSGLGQRSVTLFITEAGEGRVENFLQLVRETVLDPRVTLFKATTLEAFLNAVNPFYQPIFRDVHGRQVAMIPRYARSQWRPSHFPLHEIALPALLA